MATNCPPSATPSGGSGGRGNGLGASAGEEQVRGEAPANLRIGEAAKLAGLTARTLRYWEELGLITPSGYRESGERLYSSTDASRAARIRELQDLLGFSLAEVRIALDTEDVFDQLRSAYAGDSADPRLLQMVEDAIAANDRLMNRLDVTLNRILEFRNEQASKGERLRSGRVQLMARPRSRGEPDPEGTARRERPVQTYRSP